jgi:hypothetical protein
VPCWHRDADPVSPRTGMVWPGGFFEEGFNEQFA